MLPGGRYRIILKLSRLLIQRANIRVPCAVAGYFVLLSQAFLVVVFPNLHPVTARSSLAWVKVSNTRVNEVIKSISYR